MTDALSWTGGAPGTATVTSWPSSSVVSMISKAWRANERSATTAAAGGSAGRLSWKPEKRRQTRRRTEERARRAGLAARTRRRRSRAARRRTTRGGGAEEGGERALGAQPGEGVEDAAKRDGGERAQEEQLEEEPRHHVRQRGVRAAAVLEPQERPLSGDGARRRELADGEEGEQELEGAALVLQPGEVGVTGRRWRPSRSPSRRDEQLREQQRRLTRDCATHRQPSSRHCVTTPASDLPSRTPPPPPAAAATARRSWS